MLGEEHLEGLPSKKLSKAILKDWNLCELCCDEIRWFAPREYHVCASVAQRPPAFHRRRVDQ